MSKRIHRLSPSWEHPISAAIRQAIGAGPDEVVLVKTPQFDRLPTDQVPAEAPAGWLAFLKLYELTGAQLRTLGLGNWDGGLFLLPHEWYTHIPRGFPLECIDGTIERFEPGITDDDKRFGCLAYGVRIGPPNDGEDDKWPSGTAGAEEAKCSKS